MTTLRQAAKQALDFVEFHSKYWNGSGEHPQKIVSDLRQTLEVEQMAEPVAFSTSGAIEFAHRQSEVVVKLTRKQQPRYGFTVPLYTHPPQPALTAIPSDWKPMPVEPTREMLTTWIKADVVSNRTAPDLYRAMLAAAPKAPATGLNLNCRSEQKRLASMWGFVPAQQPMTDEQKLMCWSRATHDADVYHKTQHQCLMDYGAEIEAAHNIK